MQIFWILAFALLVNGCRQRSHEPQNSPSPPPSPQSARDAGTLPATTTDELERAALMVRLQAAIDRPIEEPSRLPEFHIWQRVNGLASPPPGSRCTWVELTPYFPGDRVRFVPSSFTENGRFTDYNLSDMRRCGFPSETSWANVLKLALVQFVRAPRMHEDIFSHAAFASGQGDDRRRILTAYGILQADFMDAGGPQTWYDFRRTTLERIYRSEALMERVYTWALPHVTRVRSALPFDDRASYLDIAWHARQYLATFDEAAEVAYLRRLEQGQCERPLTDPSATRWFRDMARPGYPPSPCTYVFTRRGPDGRDRPYRKVEAWIFRRLHDEMPRARLQRYLDRVVALFEM